MISRIRIVLTTISNVTYTRPIKGKRSGTCEAPARKTDPMVAEAGQKESEVKYSGKSCNERLTNIDISHSRPIEGLARLVGDSHHDSPLHTLL